MVLTLSRSLFMLVMRFEKCVDDSKNIWRPHNNNHLFVIRELFHSFIRPSFFLRPQSFKERTNEKKTSYLFIKVEFITFKIFEPELFLSKRNAGTKWSRDWRKGHAVTRPTYDPSHEQAPNSNTITDSMLCLQTRA